jgi:hypothetical protein
MTALVQYESACAALAAAVKADEVMAVHLSAKAIEAVARVARNFDLEVDAVKLRVRAEGRLGEMLKEASEQGLICAGPGRPKTVDNGEIEPARLREIGINRKLSCRARRLVSIGRPAIDEMLDRMDKESRLRGRVAIDVVNRELQKTTAVYQRRAGSSKGMPFPTDIRGDARDWSVGYLRRVAHLLQSIADHCGGADDGATVRDCITDAAICTLDNRATP